MRSEELEPELLLYWIQYRELEEKGGPEQDGELFEEVIGREEDILKAFGLPPAEKFNKILWKLTEKKSCTPKAIQHTISQLQAAAKEFLKKPVISGKSFLEAAQLLNLSAFDVLPELGFITHTYTLFLYDELLLKRESPPGEILQELETVRDLDLYEPVAKLKVNLKPNYRRTKAYQELKTNLQFLDAFLKQQEADLETKTKTFDQAKPGFFGEERQPEILPEPKPYKPEYQLLLSYLELEEIVFDKDSAVTVNARYFQEGARPRQIGLGFEFDELYGLLRQYEKENNGVLTYFNKNRQRIAFDSPTFINLKDKTGGNLVLNKHYLRVYKPEALNREGQLEKLREEFYLVDDILDKRSFDAEQQEYIRGSIDGWFGHIKNWYGMYLGAKMKGLSEEEARASINLDNPHIYELSKLLYNLEKFGGKALMKE